MLFRIDQFGRPGLDELLKCATIKEYSFRFLLDALIFTLRIRRGHIIPKLGKRAGSFVEATRGV